MWAGRGKPPFKPDRAQKDPDRDSRDSVRLFGLVFERKVGFGTALVAAFGALYALNAFLRGAEVSIVAPEQVTLVSYHLGKQQKYVRVFARVTIANEGEKGYDAIVTSEIVRFSVPGASEKCRHGVEQRWQVLASLPPRTDKPSRPSDDTAWGLWVDHLSYKGKGDALPFAVRAGQVVSHETFFGGRTTPGNVANNPCGFPAWKEMVDSLDHQLGCTDTTKLKRQPEVSIDFNFTAELLDGSQAASSCRALIHCGHVESLREKEYVAPACFPTGQIAKTNALRRISGRLRGIYASLTK